MNVFKAFIHSVASIESSRKIVCKVTNVKGTSRIAALFAQHLKKDLYPLEALGKSNQNGRTVLVSGAIGSGKTTFIRYFLRYLFEDDSLCVPSPTFILDNHYQLKGLSVHHMDLYRLPNEQSVKVLELEKSIREGTILHLALHDNVICDLKQKFA